MNSMEEQIQAILASLKPMLATHGKDIRVVEANGRKVKLSLTGFCGDCGCSQDYVDGLKDMLAEKFSDVEIEFEIA